MARAQNKVIAGDYNGREVNGSFGSITLYGGRSADSIFINKETVDAYELVTDEHRKSAASGAARGLVGGVLLGPVGALAGGLSATNKGVYIVAVQFKDGKKSLLEVNDKLYKLIVTNCFAYSSGSSSPSAASAGKDAAASPDEIRKSIPKEDFATGVNSLETPMPGYAPENAVNANNQRLAVKAVTALDSFIKGTLDAETVKDTLEDCFLNVSNEQSEENKRAQWLANRLKNAPSMVGLADDAIRIGHKSAKSVLIMLLDERNFLARCYIVDEKIDVKRIATKALDTARGYINDEINRGDASAWLSLYRNTLESYSERTVKDNPVFNDEDIARIVELIWDFKDGIPDSDDDSPTKDLQAIADEMAGIVDSLPDVPSVDVYYKAEESPAQEPEPQEEPEPADKTPQDAAEAAPASSADEIRKYKELLDDGIITQEEFDAKKKQLMGL